MEVPPVPAKRARKSSRKIPRKSPENVDKVPDALPLAPANMPPTGAQMSERQIQPMIPIPEGLDYSKLFLIYVSFLGDVERTAAAAGLDQKLVEQIAITDEWVAKVQSLSTVRKDQGTEAFAKELNRTLNFVQSVRVRNLLDKAIKRLTDNEQDFVDSITAYSSGHKGPAMRNVSGKALLDFTKACQIVQSMTYAALGDVPAARVTGDDDAGGAAPSLAVMRAMTQLVIDEPDKSVQLPNI